MKGCGMRREDASPFFSGGATSKQPELRQDSAVLWIAPNFFLLYRTKNLDLNWNNPIFSFQNEWLMRVLRYFVLLYGFVHFAMSCGKKSGMDVSKVKQRIDVLNKNYGKRFGSNDPKYYQELYCKDAKIFPAQMPAVEGRDAIRTFYFDDGRNTSMSNILVNATYVYGNDDLVVEEGLYDFPAPNGGTNDIGKFIVLWKKEDGTWKMYREIWNSNLPITNKP
jgi:ketosteroid isomerase-like protein